MNKRKLIKSSQFILKEENGLVVASLRDDSDYSFEHSISNMPNPRVRAPRYSKDEIKESSAIGAALANKTHEEFLSKMINATNHQIHENIHEIRKSLKRIQSQVQYVLIAEKILKDINKDR